MICISIYPGIFYPEIHSSEISVPFCLQILSVPEMCIFAELHLDSEVMSSFFAFLLIITKKRARGNLLSTKFQNSALLFTFNDETPATA